MKQTGLFSVLGRLALGLSMAACLWGCESNDSPDTDDVDSYFKKHPYVSDPRNSQYPSDVSITPSDATVTYVGQTVSFRASGGGRPYTWDVANTARGYVWSDGGDAGFYTCTAVGPNDVIVYDRHGHAAIGRINNSVAALTATAVPSTLTVDGARAQLTANGGIPPYTWSVQDALLGQVDSSSGSSVGYTRNNQGDNTVRVVDSAGSTYSIVISQP